MKDLECSRHSRQRSLIRNYDCISIYCSEGYYTSYERSRGHAILDSGKEYLLITTKVNEHIAKTLVDQQTAGADLISSTFYILHEILLYKMNPPITLQMTMQGSRGSLTHYVIVQLNWLGYLEE